MRPTFPKIRYSLEIATQIGTTTTETDMLKEKLKQVLAFMLIKFNSKEERCQPLKIRLNEVFNECSFSLDFWSSERVPWSQIIARDVKVGSQLYYCSFSIIAQRLLCLSNTFFLSMCHCLFIAYINRLVHFLTVHNQKHKDSVPQIWSHLYLFQLPSFS